MRAQTAVGSSVIRPVVLVVDDDLAVLEALSGLLAPRLEPWFQLLLASSPAEARELVGADEVSSHPIAAVICDEKMPGGSGTDLLVELLGHPGHAHGGRILITGYADLESAKRAINDAEVARYYPKPWDAEGALLPAVAELLGTFVRKRQLDRLLVSGLFGWDRACDAVLEVRRSWWEYTHLMGLSAEDAGEAVPFFERPADRSAEHVLVSELWEGAEVLAASARLESAEASVRLADIAFRSGFASDSVESLLMRTAECAARRMGARKISFTGSALREDFYSRLGWQQIVPVSEAPDGAPYVVEWSKTTEAGASDAWSSRFAREARLCSCAQEACPLQEYAAERRSYFCPLDLHEHRFGSTLLEVG